MDTAFTFGSEVCMVGNHLTRSHSADDRILYVGKKERSRSKGMTLRFSEAFTSKRGPW